MRSILVLLLLALAAPSAVAAPRKSAASAQRSPRAQTGLVFVANTGLEDVQTLSSSLRHAIAAKRSGHLDEVVWIVYGRAIVALDPTVDAVPSTLRQQIRDAREAGVRLVACAEAMRKFDIDAATVEAGVEVVPNALDEVARLVAEGYALLRY